MNEISLDTIQEFNSIMQEKGSILRLYKSAYTIYIKLVEDNYLKMDDQIINPSREFYDHLQKFFNDKNIEIEFNNTHSCFWSI